MKAYCFSALEMKEIIISFRTKSRLNALSDVERKKKVGSLYLKLGITFIFNMEN